jgi:cysteine desulfurase
MRVSHVLVALGVPERVSMGSLRITLGRPTTQAEVDVAIAAIADCVAAERARMRSSSGE